MNLFYENQQIDEYKIIKILKKNQNDIFYLVNSKGDFFFGKSFDKDSPNIYKEIYTQCSMNHPSILKIYNFFNYYSNIVFLFPKGYANLKEVAELIYRLSDNTKNNISFQIIDAIMHIHSQNKLHGDLNSENIIINFNNEIPPSVYLIDFGSSLDYGINSGNFCCSSPFFPPEYHEKREYSEKSEVWCLGIILYHIYINCQFSSKRNYYFNFPLKEFDFSCNKVISNILKQCFQFEPSNRISLKEIHSIFLKELDISDSSDFYKTFQIIDNINDLKCDHSDFSFNNSYLKPEDFGKKLLYYFFFCFTNLNLN